MFLKSTAANMFWCALEMQISYSHIPLFSRFGAVNYFLPLAKETYALFIRNPRDQEELSWTTFLSPFTWELWMFLGGHILVLGAAVRLTVAYYQGRQNVVKTSKNATFFLGI